MTQGFDTIESGVTIVSRQEGIIRDSMARQEADGQNIIGAIENLKTITGNVRQSSSLIAEEGHGVKQKTTRLTQITSEIESSMAEITIGAEQLSTGVVGIRDVSQKNKESIGTLDIEIAKFKV
jgi:methyl-accepting chemotaxis protein